MTSPLPRNGPLAGLRRIPRLQFRWLASGSKGNAGLLLIDGRPWLFDCGLSSRKLTLLLGESGVKPDDLSGIIVSHDHGDHWHGLARFRKRCSAPVYASRGTVSALERRGLELATFVRLECHRPINLDGATLTPFTLPHDASEPLGFRIDYRGASLTVATDVGRMTPEILEHIDHCDLLCLESNHDEVLLTTCRYPDWLKHRIRGPNGHLANRDTSAALARLRRLPRHLLLAHVSEEANTPECIIETVGPALEGIEWHIALQHEPSPWIASAEPIELPKRSRSSTNSLQPVLPFDEAAVLICAGAAR